LEGFSKEAVDFLKQAGTLFLFFSKRQPKIVKTLCDNSESTDLIFRTFKNIYSLDNSLGVKHLKHLPFVYLRNSILNKAK
jgi:hypothetical protein